MISEYLGIVGTIVGVIVGSVTTYKIQERRLSHEDQTRFQESRLEHYARFTAAANDALSLWRTNQPAGDAVGEFLLCSETIRLISTGDVFSCARRFHEVFGRMQDIVGDGGNPEELMTEFHTEMAAFVTACRRELGTEAA